jgi:hypothetical protein
LTALYLAEVTESNARTARDLAQRGTFLLAEVAKDIADFVSH